MKLLDGWIVFVLLGAETESFAVYFGVKPGALKPVDEGKSFVPFSSHTAVVNFFASTDVKESAPNI